METKVTPGRKIIFKPYDQNQFVRVPIQIEEFILPGHLVRIIDGAIEQLKEEHSTLQSGSASPDRR